MPIVPVTFPRASIVVTMRKFADLLNRTRVEEHHVWVLVKPFRLVPHVDVTPIVPVTFLQASIVVTRRKFANLLHQVNLKKKRVLPGL